MILIEKKLGYIMEIYTKFAADFVLKYRIDPVKLNLVERTHLPPREPHRDTVEVERMVACTPHYRALFRIAMGVCLAFDTRIREVIPTYRTILNLDV